MSTTDVAVVGGGPAGSAAAIWLARHGLSVTIVDRATFPREKPCGDGLTTMALHELESLGLDPSVVGSWTTVFGARIHSPSGSVVEVPLDAQSGIEAAVAPRAQLDTALVDLAAESGVEVRLGCACEGVQIDADRAKVIASAGPPVAARYVIAADGMWSQVGRAVGLTRSGERGQWHAYRQYFADVEDSDRPTISVFLEPDLLPGYAWSFPLAGGMANVGYGVRRRSDPLGHSGRLWHELLTRPHVAAVLGPAASPIGRLRSWPIPARFPGQPLAAARVLLVGDAAGATDPMTGEGIGQALLTGRLAAHAIATAGPRRSELACSTYQRAAHEALAADHRLSRWLSEIVLSRRLTATAALGLASTSRWSRRQFGRWMFEAYPRAAVCTPSRWSTVWRSAPAFRNRGGSAPDGFEMRDSGPERAAVG